MSMVPSTAMYSVGQTAYKQVFGIYAASIVNASDPLQQGRVQLLIPQVLGSAYSNWADRIGLPWDTTMGTPIVGQTVLAMFEGGDVNRPCYFPGGWNPSGNIIISNLNIPANSGSHFGVDHNGLIYLISGSLGTTLRALAQVVGDTGNRWQMDASGKMIWGSGTGAGDVNFYRQGVGVLATDQSLNIGSFLASLNAITGFTNVGSRGLADTNNRWQADNTGKNSWGPGNAAVDTVLYRSGVAQLASDNIVKNVSGSGETWHAMTLQNSWVNTGGAFVTAQYRLDTDNSVWLVGDISSGTITSPTTIATLPVGYRPVHSNSIPLMLATGSASAPILSPVVAVDGTGNLQVYNIPTGTNRIIFNGKIRLDA